MKKKVLVLVLTVCMVLAAGAAFAANTSGNVTVTASVVNICTVTGTTAMDFGTVTPGTANQANTSNGAVNFQCTNGDTYTVSLGTSAESVADAGACGTYCMAATVGATTYYMPYTPALSGSTTGTSTSMGNTLTTTVTGTTSPAANLPAGSYSDSLTVDIAY